MSQHGGLTSMAHFFKVTHFFQMWPIYGNLTHFNSPSVTPFSKRVPFFSSRSIFTEFSKCDSIFQAWRILPSVNPFFSIATHFPTLIHYSHFLLMCPIYLPCFSMCDICFQCDFSSSVSQFYKLEPLLLVWPPFLRVSHFFKFNPFFKCLRLFQVWSTFFQVLITRCSRRDLFF